MNSRAMSALASSLAAVILLAGCGGDSDEEKKDEESAPAPTSGQVTQENMPELPTLNEQEGVRKDLADAKCDRDGSGKWTGSGTMKNTSDKDLTFVVSFSVAATEGGTVRARAVEVVDLKAGEEAEISQKEFFTSTEDGLQCVITANRGVKA